MLPPLVSVSNFADCLMFVWILGAWPPALLLLGWIGVVAGLGWGEVK